MPLGLEGSWLAAAEPREMRARLGGNLTVLGGSAHLLRVQAISDG